MWSEPRPTPRSTSSSWGWVCWVARWRGVHLQSHLLQHPPHRAGDGEEEVASCCGCVAVVIMMVWSTPPPTPGPLLATTSWRGELARPLILDCGGRRKQYWWRKWGILQWDWWVPVFESFTMMYIIFTIFREVSGHCRSAGYVHDCTVLQVADGPEVWLLVIVATYK